MSCFFCLFHPKTCGRWTHFEGLLLVKGVGSTHQLVVLLDVKYLHPYLGMMIQLDHQMWSWETLFFVQEKCLCQTEMVDPMPLKKNFMASFIHHEKLSHQKLESIIFFGFLWLPNFYHVFLLVKHGRENPESHGFSAKSKNDRLRLRPLTGGISAKNCQVALVHLPCIHGSGRLDDGGGTHTSGTHIFRDSYGSGMGIVRGPRGPMSLGIPENPTEGSCEDKFLIFRSFKWC